MQIIPINIQTCFFQFFGFLRLKCWSKGQITSKIHLMHTNWCVLIEISMEIGMLNFWMGLLVTALMKENYFSYELKTIIVSLSILVSVAWWFPIGMNFEVATSWLFVKYINKNWKITVQTKFFTCKVLYRWSSWRRHENLVKTRHK
jgi:hypothetical protein